MHVPIKAGSTAEAKSSQAQLSEAQLRLLLDGVNDVVTILDAEGNVTFVSAAVERLFGRRPADLLGQGFNELVHPDDLPVAIAALQSVVATPGNSTTVELRALDGRGNVREIRTEARNLLHDPVLRGIVLTSHDVTDRNAEERKLREREQAYASLLSNLAGMGYRCKNDDVCSMLLVTDGSRTVTGYDPEQLLDNRDVAYGDLIHPDDAEPLWAARQANLAAHRTCNNEYRIQTQSGEWRWVLDIANGVYEPEGELVAIEGFIIDVTEKKRLEEQLSHSQRLEGIGRLAGGIAHDFNNLLAVVMSYSELASAQLEPDHKVREDLSQVLDATHRAKELTHQLLAFASEQLLEPKALDLGGMARDLERLLQRVLGEDIALSTRVPSGLWPVWGDQGQMGQVLLNLAVNARDAMPQGGELSIELANQVVGELPASAPPETKPGEYVQLSVRDSGTGMSEELQRRIFEPFFSTKGRGSGLGLATVYGIVKQAGGFLIVKSAPGQGSEFRVFFPRTRNAVRAALSAVPNAPRPDQHKTVLLVEDEPTVRRGTARMLKLLGFGAVSAESGEAALKLLGSGEHDIDLVLTDIVMRGMSGLELVEKLRAEAPTLPVLFMSGYSGGATVDLGDGERAAFLPKPFSAEALAQKLAALLNVAE